MWISIVWEILNRWAIVSASVSHVPMLICVLAFYKIRNIRSVTGGTLMRGYYHLCDIEFHRSVIRVSDYLVRTRYVPTYDAFQGLSRTRGEPTTPLLTLSTQSIFISLSLHRTAVLPTRLLLRESSEGVSNVLPSCGPVYGVRLPYARFTVN